VRLALVGLVLLACSTVARGDELERLRSENAELRARIQALEAENARLKRTSDAAPLAAALEASAAAAVTGAVDDAGTTRIATEPSRLEVTAGPRTRHWMVLRTADADALELVIESSASGRAYRDARALDLGVDGAKDSLSVTRYGSEDRSPLRGGAAPAAETVVVAVPLATLGRLASARAVDGALGPLRFTLTPQQLATVRAFADRVQRTR
jgi:hypothetical protein